MGFPGEPPTFFLSEATTLNWRDRVLLSIASSSNYAVFPLTSFWHFRPKRPASDPICPIEKNTARTCLVSFFSPKRTWFLFSFGSMGIFQRALICVRSSRFLLFPFVSLDRGRLELPAWVYSPDFTLITAVDQFSAIHDVWPSSGPPLL